VIPELRPFLGLVALWWTSSSLSAQDSLQVAPGARLRVTVESSISDLASGSYTTLPDATRAWSTGVFRELTDTTLLLTSGNSTLVIPRISIAQLERSLGRRPSVAGGVVGFVLGGAVGGGIACFAKRDSYGVPCMGAGGAPVLLGAGLGGAIGATLLSRRLSRERWSIVEVDQLLVPGP
jgi:hypothetical protein